MALAPPVAEALALLEVHYQAFHKLVKIARETGHPVPLDTRAWSQILVSVLCGIKGLDRKKGADFADGSDVKAASTWEAIDTPRFNGVIKAGTQATTAGKIESLDATPFLFLVLWDRAPERLFPRCRIWCVRPPHDTVFRAMCIAWYKQRDEGTITSDNFQLHPPRELDSDVIRNTCGNLVYPLLFCAERVQGTYTLIKFDPGVMKKGQCSKVD